MEAAASGRAIIATDVAGCREIAINNYNANYNVMHVDFYREPNKKRWVELGFNELVYSSDIVLIEWADLIPDILPDDTKFIQFEHYNQNYRKISLL